MRIDVSEPPVLCGCDTCVQHRTFITQETEPSNVIGSSLTPVPPVSSGPVQALGSTSDQSSRTETPPLAPPPVTTSVNPEPPQPVDDAHADESAAPTSSTSSPVQTSSPPTISSFPPVVSSQPARDLGPTGSLPGPFIGCSSPGPSIASSSSQASVTNLVGSSPSRPSRWGPPVQAPPFTSTASSSSTLVTPSQLQLRWGSSVQAPVQAASAFPPPFSYPDGPNVGISQSSPFGPTQDFANALRTTPKNPFPGFSVDYLPRCPSFLGPNPQTTTPVPGRSPFWPGVATEQGSRYPRYAPTPDLDRSGGQGMRLMSISASNSHGHKSHEELRWEDYKNGDKGGVAWYSPPDHSPSVYAPPSRPDRPRMRTIDLTHRDMSGFPIDYNIPTAVQRPHEPAAVSSPSSGCTACGATNSSSSVHLGLNNTTNPPSSATSLPGLFFSPYGSCPLVFATPNLAAHGIITTPAVQAYAMILGTNLTSQGITAAPAVQAYPVMFVTPNLAGQGTTTTPAAQPYPTMFGTPTHVAQGTTTTPATQPYATVFGTPSLASQGTTTNPAAQPYPTMFGTPNIVTQGTTTTPAAQPYTMIFGTPNLGAQGITPAAQAYPVNGLNLLPFSAMSLQ